MIRLLAVLLILWPVLARAESVVVRSGDHADFSRLVLDLDGAPDWAFGRVDGGYEFRPERTDLHWDLRVAFDRISRARIRALEDRGDGRLFIAVDCSCHADAFVLRDGRVVLDIKDGPSPFTASPYEIRLAISEPAASSGSGSALGPRAVARPVNELGTARPSDRDIGGRAGLPLLLPSRSAEGSTAAASRPLAATERAPAAAQTVQRSQPFPAGAPGQIARGRVSETEAALIEQIARAASQGLIEADMSQIEGDILAATHRVPPPAPEPEAPEPPRVATVAVTPRGHVAIETGIDRALPANTPDRATTDEGGACTDPEMFDISSWGGPMENGADIGAFRSRLIGEFDLANGVGVTDLARHYLYITFGAEAKALVGQYSADVVRPDLLKAMAEIIDAGQAETADIFVDQMACDGATALWAALAQPRLFRGQAINTEAITLAFAGLPRHLRRHLGPGLADAFLDIADIATAERIRNAIARGTEEPDPGLDVLSARLDLAAGETGRAAAQLDKVIAQESDDLPVAILSRVEAALANGEAIAPEQISLLQSLAFERKGTERGAELIVMELRARAMSGDLEGAFDRLAVAQGTAMFTTERIAPLVVEVFSALSRDASDATFLKLAVAHLDEAVTLAAPVRRDIAARFLELRLAAPARRVLGGEGAMPDKPDRLLFANAAMIEGRPEVAVGYLAGLEGADAVKLRAQAMEQAGDFAQSARLFATIGLDDNSTRAAWRGGIWEAVASRSGALAAAAGLMGGSLALAARPPIAKVPDLANAALPPPSVPEASETQTPLARASTLVDESRATRAVLDDLLQTVTPPPELPGA